MITRLSKWLLYIASYSWMYMLLIISVSASAVANSPRNNQPFGEYIQQIASSNKWTYLVLFALSIFSIIYSSFFTKTLSCNTRIHYSLDKEITVEGAFLLIPLAATTLTINLNQYGIIISVFIFVCMGFVFDMTNHTYALPIFLIKRYHTFIAKDSGEKIRIMTKMSEEEYRIALDNHPDGIQAREIVKGTYLVTPKT